MCFQWVLIVTQTDQMAASQLCSLLHRRGRQAVAGFEVVVSVGTESDNFMCAHSSLTRRNHMAPLTPKPGAQEV